MPANRPSNPYQAPRPGKPAERDSVAEDLVRSWGPAMRGRIRSDALTWPDSDVQRALVGLIDKVNEEEAA